MPLVQIAPDQNLGLVRSQVVVCIPVFDAYDLVAQCLLSVLTHTDPETPILICDDASSDTRIWEMAESTLGAQTWANTVYYLRQPQNIGFVENANGAMAVSSPADIVILNSDCIVSGGWLGGLRDAAYSESRVATATALTNAGTIVSVPSRNQPVARLPDGVTVDRLAADVRQAAIGLRPDVPTCVGHCAYIRRDAIELVGSFDTAFSPGYEEEVDFSQRCIQRGLRHVVADDVFVFHHEMGSFGSFGRREAAQRRREEQHEKIRVRYPYFDQWCQAVSTDKRSPLARALTAATRVVRGTSVTIDGRCLTHSWTGTQLVTIGAIDALAGRPGLRLRVLVPEDFGGVSEGLLSDRTHVDLLTLDRVAGSEPTDVVHRPYQVSSPSDLKILPDLGNRVVLSHLDNIALRNPGYFDDFQQWREYSRLTEISLGGADHVIFISRHAAQDALTLELVTEDQVSVVEPATDVVASGVAVQETRPRGAEKLDDHPFLLCLGTDFRHKNRPFAQRLFAALKREGIYDGLLAFAGPKVALGSSAGEEAEYLLRNPELGADTVDIGAVDEAGKAWLIRRATAVIYPTVYEGFGLVPFEAAAIGTPCLFASHTSLAEVLPESVALLVAWDADASARRVAPVLSAGPARDQLVRSIQIAGARFTSLRNGAGLAAAYEKAVTQPARHGLWSELVAAEAEADALRQRIELNRRELELVETEVGHARSILGDPLNRGLVGPDAVLPPELRRAVLAVVTRARLRRFAKSLYRTAYALRHPRRSIRSSRRRQA